MGAVDRAAVKDLATSTLSGLPAVLVLVGDVAKIRPLLAGFTDLALPEPTVVSSSQALEGLLGAPR